MSRFSRGLLDALFPPVCPLCQASTPEEHQLCSLCQQGLPPPPEKYCLRCGGDTGRPEQGCGQCLANPNAADAAYFAFLYQGHIIDLIVGFKFSDRSERSVLLGRLCWERLGSSLTWEAPELVIPMPLHPVRLIKRRYNQAALLAGELAKHLNRPLVTNALYRSKMTAPQTRLNARARMRNVRGAFRVIEERVKGKSILLVDDVMTTGATLGVAVSALKKAGASRVAGFCMARVDPDRTLDNSVNQGVSHA